MFKDNLKIVLEFIENTTSSEMTAIKLQVGLIVFNFDGPNSSMEK